MKSNKKYISIFSILMIILLFTSVFTFNSINPLFDKQKKEGFNDKQDGILNELHTNQAEDAYEENDIQSSAYDLSLFENHWLSNISGLGVQKDDDWYRIEITTGYQRLVVHLLFSDVMGDIDISVYNSAGIYITGNITTTDNEYIDYILPSSGTYYLRVYYDNAGNTYDLLWDDIINGATDDYYEENDVYPSAYDISTQERKWLSSIYTLGIKADNDWYEIAANPDALRVIAFCIFSHAAGDINIALYNSTGGLLQFSGTTTDNEGIDYIVSGAGTYYLLVYGENLGNTYDLYWDDLNATDDWYEENDLRTSAFDISLWERNWLTSRYNYPNGLAVQADDDWYEIIITAGYEHLAVSLVFSDTAGNIDIEVYNSSGSLITGSYSYTDDEYIDYKLTSSGTYYLKIFGDNNGNLYDLWWDDLSSPSDDLYEENDDISESHNLRYDEQRWLTELKGYGVQTDDDWYEILITSGFLHLHVNCTFSDAAGDINIVVYNNVGALMTGSYSNTDNEYIDYKLPSSGTYYILVYGDNAGNTYDLWWDDLLSPSDDLYEENDDISESYYLGSYEQTWLTYIKGYGEQGDDDWYEILITAGYENLIVNCTFSNASGDIDIAVFNSVGTYITSSTSITDDEYIDVILPSSGIYYILVFGENASNTYDLWWDDVLLPATDDAYEENDDIPEAYDLTSYDGIWLSNVSGLGIQYDYDVYEIYIPSGFERLIVECVFSHSAGNISLIIFNSTGDAVTWSYSETDNETIDEILPSSGTYYILVYGEDTGNTYDLMWDALIPIADDAYEENDDPTEAYDLTSYPNTWLTAISGAGIQADYDFYKVSITTTGQNLVIDLTFDSTEGVLFLSLTDSSLNVVALSNSTGDSQYINYKIAATGTYYIIIFGFGYGNSYDLRYRLASDGKPTISAFNMLFLIIFVFGISAVVLRNHLKKLILD